ncbi:MAG: nucleoside triphosphate pyrophosphohydrolase [Anaerolineaceae bacterium]
MKKQTIWIIGIYAQTEKVLDAARTAGLIIGRGTLAARWLDEIGVKDPELLLFPQDSSDANENLIDKLEQAKRILGAEKSMIFVTQANPLSTDYFAAQLVDHFPEADIHWVNGNDLCTNADSHLATNRNTSLLVMDGMVLGGKYHLPFDASQRVLLYYPDAAVDFSRLSSLLTTVYPQGHEVSVLFERADAQINWNQFKIEDLVVIHTPVAALLIPPRAADSSLVSFEELIAHLRAPEGCPWDKKQTHDSLRTYLLEETYEALEALDQHDTISLKEELGDILLQIALHAQIAVENHEFNMADVLEGINRKIVYRHPHIFADTRVDGVGGVLQNWEKLKEQERTEQGEGEQKGLLDGIPLSFPALAQAQAIQERAAHVGFDWKEIGPVIAKVLEEFDEVKTAPNEEERAKELGDLLFAVVNLVRWYHVDAESVLRGTNIKFRRRFAYIEKKSRDNQKPMQEMTLDEMDAFWNEAKKTEK